MFRERSCHYQPVISGPCCHYPFQKAPLLPIEIKSTHRHFQINGLWSRDFKTILVNHSGHLQVSPPPSLLGNGTEAWQTLGLLYLNALLLRTSDMMTSGVWTHCGWLPYTPSSFPSSWFQASQGNRRLGRFSLGTKSQGGLPSETLGPLDLHLKEYIGLVCLAMLWSQTVEGLLDRRAGRQ